MRSVCIEGCGALPACPTCSASCLRSHWARLRFQSSWSCSSSTSVVPRSVLILYPPVLILLMAGSRFTYRVWKEHRLYSPLAALGEPVLILGAGEAGARLAKELTHSRIWRIAGLLDDNPAKQGRLLRNISVLGPIAELPLWAKRFGVRTVILALPSAAHGVRRRVAELCAAAGVEALTVPSYDDLISGRSQLTTIRHVELDDLLGRDPVVLDSAGLGEWLGGRVVMVTGAGGSIGAELCRQIARFRPARLVLLDLSEFGLYQIQQALQDDFPELPLVTLVGDVKHVALIDQVLASERPSVLFHAAAYKHVPLMEESNAWQAVRNNAWGTWVLAQRCACRARREVRAGVDRQGGQSDQRDGRVQADGGDGLPEPAERHDAVRHRSFWQRFRQHRQRHSPFRRSRSRAAGR